MTLLEQGFPFDAVSRLVAADRRSRDAAYQVHRWWARRPPALVRAALIAARIPADTTVAAFRAAYGSTAPLLTGTTVLDPFAGGGTTLVEAARLGAIPVGRDIDPLAVLLVGHQLEPARAEAVQASGERLLAHLRVSLGDQWESTDADWAPLHYFTIPVVMCSECDHAGPLYRSLVIGRSTGAAGGVVRDAEVSAFCPDCYTTHSLKATAKTLTCCGHRRPLHAATYIKGRYRCPGCKAPSDHERLQTGAAPRVLVGVEETSVNRGTRRRIRPATDEDLHHEHRAAAWLAARAGRPLPLDRPIVTAPGDNRPVSHGITTIGMLHTARQAAYLAAAHDWIDDAGLDDGTERALRITVSSTVSSNNRLCGYATDYGRLAPLFSIRAFALPALTVELNPLNPSGGRGTLAAALLRTAKAADGTVRRHVLDSKNRPIAVSLGFPARNHPGAVATADSTSATRPDAPQADICLTDPPYYDFIPYDALSQVYRAWLPEQDLDAAPLLPAGDDPVADFGSRLGAALSTAAGSLKRDGLVAFTYKGGGDAWDAVGVALDEAKLRVTALWPVLADPHMGHHSHPGNCEYDLLIVARAVEQATPAEPTTSTVEWKHRLGDVSPADEKNFDHAMRIAGPRWGSPLAR
ncbi:DUF1156 domain-containing protein [Aquipuribacter hungaricus]|uniref:DUF1156 domain-containing protein n=1 Tax=Aquipuribacter hungaricus TaxID=545624 RepID=A0ABV7WKV4_9MICO